MCEGPRRPCEDAGVADAPAYFTRIGPDEYLPTRFAQSHWGPDRLNGPAVVGMVAHALETRCGSPDFMPTRLTVDMFRAAHRVPTTVEIRVVRDGRRVQSAECDVHQGDRLVARATLVQYRRSAPPPGSEWTPPVEPPQLPTPDNDLLPYVGSDAGGWTRSPAEHQNTSRKRFHYRAINILDGQDNSPFERAVVTAEATSLVTNLGTRGIGYINGDLTVALARLPVGEWVCVQADTHWTADGISVGTATLFDQTGPFGSGMVTAVANAAAQIDFSQRWFAPGEINYE